MTIGSRLRLESAALLTITPTSEAPSLLAVKLRVSLISQVSTPSSHFVRSDKFSSTVRVKEIVQKF